MYSLCRMLSYVVYELIKLQSVFYNAIANTQFVVLRKKPGHIFYVQRKGFTGQSAANKLGVQTADTFFFVGKL